MEINRGIMRTKIFLKGPILSRSGYGEQTRFAFRALANHLDKFDIYVDALNWGKTGWLVDDDEERKYIDSLLVKTQEFIQSGGQFDVSVQVTIPNEWQKLAPINIGYTAGVECNHVSPAWYEKIQVVDKVLVTSEHTKSGFVSTVFQVVDQNTNQVINSVTCADKIPFDVVHYPVREFDSAEIDLDFEPSFNFLSVAQWAARKNVDNTIKWFVEKFFDKEVGLVLKLNKQNNSTMDRHHTREHIKSILDSIEGDKKCKIYLLHGDMSDEEMTSLYKHPKIKAFATLTHGEGFGLPLFEAAYHGLPIIAPAWSGHCDFLYIPSEESGKKKRRNRKSAMFAKIDYELKNVQEKAVWKGVIEPEAMWCFPKKESYKLALGDVYNSYEKHKSKAQKLKKHILQNFKEEDMYDKFVDSIEEVLDSRVPTNTMEESESVVIL
jgi:glycosyltransferase involved in cell wall biosynthesis